MTDLNNLSVGELQTMIENAESALKNKQVSQRKEVFAQIKALADSVGVSVEIHETGKKQKTYGSQGSAKISQP